MNRHFCLLLLAFGLIFNAGCGGGTAETVPAPVVPTGSAAANGNGATESGEGEVAAEPPPGQEPLLPEEGP